MGQKEFDQVEALSHQLTELKHELTELKQVLIGDLWHRQDGLIETVRGLKTYAESSRLLLRVNVVGWIINGLAWAVVLTKMGWAW